MKALTAWAFSNTVKSLKECIEGILEPINRVCEFYFYISEFSIFPQNIIHFYSIA